MRTALDGGMCMQVRPALPPSPLAQQCWHFEHFDVVSCASRPERFVLRVVGVWPPGPLPTPGTKEVDIDLLVGKAAAVVKGTKGVKIGGAGCSQL